MAGREDPIVSYRSIADGEIHLRMQSNAFNGSGEVPPGFPRAGLLVSLLGWCIYLG
jgi:hypothetical protein